FRAALTSSSEAFLMNPGSCALSQTPSYIWMTSTSPTLNFATSAPGDGCCAKPLPTNSNGPLRPKPPPAPPPQITKPRREMLCIATIPPLRVPGRSQQLHTCKRRFHDRHPAFTQL